MRERTPASVPGVHDGRDVQTMSVERRHVAINASAQKFPTQAPAAFRGDVRYPTARGNLNR
jgi:hypothetical protein